MTEIFFDREVQQTRISEALAEFFNIPATDILVCNKGCEDKISEYPKILGIVYSRIVGDFFFSVEVITAERFEVLPFLGFLCKYISAKGLVGLELNPYAAILFDPNTGYHEVLLNGDILDADIWGLTIEKIIDDTETSE
jgi:hypothetical protein